MVLKPQYGHVEEVENKIRRCKVAKSEDIRRGPHPGTNWKSHSHPVVTAPPTESHMASQTEWHPGWRRGRALPRAADVQLHCWRLPRASCTQNVERALDRKSVRWIHLHSWPNAAMFQISPGAWSHSSLSEEVSGRDLESGWDVEIQGVGYQR